MLGLPSSLAGYLLAHSAYLLTCGMAALLLARRLAPCCSRWAVLAAAGALVWAPLDRHRLNALNDLQYSGAILAALLALLALVEWARGAGPLALAGALGAAFLALRTYEGTLGLLSVGGAVLAGALAAERRRSLLRVLAIWELSLTGLAGFVVIPLLGTRSYQLSGLRLDPTVAGLPGRMAQQFQWEIGPLLPGLGRLVDLRVGVAVAGLVAAVTAIGGEWSLSRGRAAALAGAGVLMGVAGWLPALLSPSVATPERMQGVAAPGFGLALGAVAMLVGSFLPRRVRAPAVLCLAGWVVAAGTAGTLALQRAWDADSFYPRQSRLLRELVALAPDLRDGTLIVLLDGEQVFPATFTFRHAVSYLYGGRAEGLVVGGFDFLYPAWFEADAVRSRPWPVIQRPWRAPARSYPYRALVIVREVNGRLALAEHWPEELPASAGAAGYAPLGRVVRGAVAATIVVPGP